jgi:hypothetical protein
MRKKALMELLMKIQAWGLVPLLLCSKLVVPVLARAMRIPLSISPHKNTDLIFVDRLENPWRVFGKNDENTVINFPP